jgi:hypothetical protein
MYRDETHSSSMNGPLPTGCGWPQVENAPL